MSGFRWGLAAVMVGGILAGPAAAQNRQAARPSYPTRVELSNGRVWERIEMKYIDARTLSAMFGAPNLPTELDIWAMQNARYRAGAGYGGGYGASYGPGYGSGYGAGSYGQPGGYGTGGYGGGLPQGYGPTGGSGGRSIYGDPNSNSLILGPRMPGGPGGTGRGPAGNNRLFPNLIILGDPRTNSLIVDP